MVQKVLTYKTTMYRLKAIFFSPIDIALKQSHILASYLSGIYLESWLSWLWGGVQKTLKKGRKQTEEKH